MRLGAATLVRCGRWRGGFCLKYNRAASEWQQQVAFFCRLRCALGAATGLDLEQALSHECVTDGAAVNGGARIGEHLSGHYVRQIV